MSLIFSLFLLLNSFWSVQVNLIMEYDIIVAGDGSGHYTNVQDAIDAIPHLRKKRTIVYIKNGIYKEKLILPATKTNVSFIGESKEKTILTYDDYASRQNKYGEEIGTSGSSSFYVYGDGFEAQNITFENSAGQVGQAVAIRVDADRVSFKNCHFLGNQDTLYLHGRSSRQYYKDCYIEGTVDFIFGWSTALFDNCEIYCKNKGYITAASTEEGEDYGMVFRNCTITGDAAPGSFYLGRPWRPNAQTVFLNCYMDSLIKAEGWHNWNKEDAEKTAFYAEYNSRGPGATPKKRVAWSHQLTKEEAQNYTMEQIFGDWNPSGTSADPIDITLYPDGIPNAKKVPDPEEVDHRSNGTRFIKNTAHPTLTLYQPKYPNGQAVVICPGGGYRGTAIDKEGVLVAQSLNEAGVTAFVLKYRIPNDATNVDKSIAPLQDAQQAIKVVREGAEKWKVDPEKIGIMGFSAGGHLAASAATRFKKPVIETTTSVRPDFAILIYPVISLSKELMHEGSRTNLLGKKPSRSTIELFSPDQQIDAQSPPAFLVHAADDKSVKVGNSLAYYTACVTHGVPAEMHLYPKGGHGFGMYNQTTSDRWVDRLKNWLKTL